MASNSASNLVLTKSGNVVGGQIYVCLPPLLGLYCLGHDDKHCRRYFEPPVFSLKNMFIMFLINIPVSSMSKTDRYASWSTRVYADVSIEPRSDPPRLVLCLVLIAIFILEYSSCYSFYPSTSLCSSSPSNPFSSSHFPARRAAISQFCCTGH